LSLKTGLNGPARQDRNAAPRRREYEDRYGQFRGPVRRRYWRVFEAHSFTQESTHYDKKSYLHGVVRMHIHRLNA
jgi:hypothetical protein